MYRWTSLSLVVLLALAVTLFWATFLVIVVGVYEDSVRGRQLVESPGSIREDLGFSASGEPLILRQQWTNGPSERTVLTLEREPAADDAAIAGRFWQSDLGDRPHYYSRSGFPLAQLETPGQYFVWKDRTGGYFVRYDVPSRKVVGYYGTGGRRESIPPESELFPVGREVGRLGTSPFQILQPADIQSRKNDATMEAGEYSTLLLAARSPLAPGDLVFVGGGQLYRVNTDSGEVEHLLPGIEVLVAGIIGRMHPSGESIDQWLVARTPDSLVLLQPALGTSPVVLNTPGVDVSRSISVTTGPAGRAIAWQATVPTEDLVGMHPRRVWLFGGESLTRQASVELDYHYPWRPIIDERTSVRLFAATAGSPGVSLATTLVLFPWLESTTVGESEARLPWSASWPVHLVWILTGALAVLLTIRHRQRLRLLASVGWIVSSALLGLPGYAGYRLHRRWRPVLVSPPVSTGIEIRVPPDPGT